MFYKKLQFLNFTLYYDKGFYVLQLMEVVKQISPMLTPCSAYVLLTPKSKFSMEC